MRVASTPRRPAVSMMTTSWSLRLASSIDAARDVDRVATVLDSLGVARLGGEDGDADALAVDLQLLDGVGTLEVGRDEHRRLVLVLEPQRELGRERRLAGTLEAGEHDDRRPALGVAQAARLAAEDRDELLVDDLDDLLRRVEGAADLLGAGALLHRPDELLHHGQRDVGLEQRDADLARGGVDVGLGEPALAPQVLEGVGKAVGECGEHGVGLSLASVVDQGGSESGTTTKTNGRTPSGLTRRAHPPRSASELSRRVPCVRHGRPPRPAPPSGAPRRPPGRRTRRPPGGRAWRRARRRP